MSVVVLGMHRSGTSAATRIISLLGVPLCRPGDLLRGHSGNERGHWESAPLVVENERLLQALAARWWCPPDDVHEVTRLAEDHVSVERARQVFRSSHPGSQWVWKDPRLCILLPFWRQALAQHPVAVVVYRDPAEVVASLRRRNNFSVDFGLALWERYVTLMSQGAQGMPSIVARYSDLVRDPVTWAARVCRFLAANAIDARMPTMTAGLRSFVSSDLHHTFSSEEIAAQMTPSQLSWLSHLDEQADATSQGTSAWTQVWDHLPEVGTGAISTMRAARTAFGLDVGSTQTNRRQDSGARQVRVLEPERVTSRAPMPRGRVSVILLPDGRAATREDAARLVDRLPAEAEFVTVVTAEDEVAAGRSARTDSRARDLGVPDQPALLEIHRPGPLSLAQRLNLAAEVARNDVLVILAGRPITPRKGWLPALRRTLESSAECAVVTPALCAPGDGATAFGLTTDALLVDVGWHTEESEPMEPFPVWSASVTALVTTKRHLSAVGGFDQGLTGAGREDLDLCLRLWRAGWTCLAVPEAQVDVDLSAPDAKQLDLLTNLIRLGHVHLGSEELTEQITYLADCPAFDKALSGVNAGDAGLRRCVVAAMSWYGTAELSELAVTPAAAAQSGRGTG